MLSILSLTTFAALTSLVSCSPVMNPDSRNSRGGSNNATVAGPFRPAYYHGTIQAKISAVTNDQITLILVDSLSNIVNDTAVAHTDQAATCVVDDPKNAGAAVKGPCSDPSWVWALDAFGPGAGVYINHFVQYKEGFYTRREVSQIKQFGQGVTTDFSKYPICEYATNGQNAASFIPEGVAPSEMETGCSSLDESEPPARPQGS